MGEQVQLLPGNLLDPLPEPVDIVVANLPYVATEELSSLPADVRNHEPLLALDGGPGGLVVIEAALRDIATKPALRARLPQGSRIYLEIGSRQGTALRALAAQWLPEARFDLYLDYADLDRVAMITL